MRIRKRAVPLPFSLLTPVPFADPNFNLVQLSQPSDLPAPPSHVHDHRHLVKAFEDEKTSTDQGEESNSTSKQSDLGAVADDNGVELIPLPLPSPHSNQTKVEGRWCDKDKAIPLKKRKASFEMNGMVVSGEYSKMKSKTNKKCSLIPFKTTEEDDDDEEDDHSDSDTKKRKIKRKLSNKKKTRKKKGGSLMEGSRCSRVNGRGWRCMQPTLVGYSLCEHHLGKGRLRSMSSVRARSINLNSSTTTQLSTCDEDKSCNGGNPSKEDEMMHDDEDVEKKSMNSMSAGNGRKRMKVGMVKARSLRSLLFQPNTTTTSVVQIGATCHQAT